MTDLSVVIVTQSNSFPEGMAPGQRIKNLAAILIKSGVKIFVLISRSNEKLPYVLNKNAKGNFQGIDFEYTTGTTVRSQRFFMRRWQDFKGMLNLFFRLWVLKKQGKLDFIYYYDVVNSNSIDRWISYTFAWILKVPLIVEITECPWTLRQNTHIVARKMTPLWGVDGAVLISHFLFDWARGEIVRNRLKTKIIRIPILVDTNEQKPHAFPEGDPVALIASSPSYDAAIIFVLQAMNTVWQTRPDCKLIITGGASRKSYDRAMKTIINNPVWTSNIQFAGLVEREKLLNFYASSWALLIPLFDDLISRARFPTKIGEYLASGRPVITSNVGEIPKFLEEGKSAYICEPENPDAFGEKILEVINDPIKANKIGLQGREIAVNHFDNKNYDSSLRSFLNSIK